MDKSLHPARPHNQTLVLSNHLVITTVEFLNKFAEECDAKLCKLHQKMQRLEIEVKLLEFKLSSIPGALLPAIAWILASMCMQWAVSPSRRAGLASRRCTLYSRSLALPHRPRRRAAGQHRGGRHGRPARYRKCGTASAAADRWHSPAAATDQHDRATAAWLCSRGAASAACRDRLCEG